jgi:hypothetical protein
MTKRQGEGEDEVGRKPYIRNQIPDVGSHFPDASFQWWRKVGQGKGNGV